ncbi:hypothetical protein NQ317_009676 [Molorchus minor]|uniref:Uncharacterized protein n=1 Tax=Molorchus minor TaxID=1323400 RepID=A0ABQ9JIH3_9CUCU|nr:hypothetical protein NQ317_009676 [Molorchus minor]
MAFKEDFLVQISSRLGISGGYCQIQDGKKKQISSSTSEDEDLMTVRRQLYIKITAFEHEDLIQKMKSDKFEPTISLKMETNTATLRATVNKYNIEEVKILIRLVSKNIVGKKVLLGKIEIDSKSSIWQEIVATPLVPVTKMINFE